MMRHSPRPSTQMLMLLAILALAASLRAYGLAGWPMDQDELYTLRDATNLAGVSHRRPFYFVLQSLLLTVMPPTPLNLRVPPFLFGLIGVWLTWVLAKRRFGITAAVVAASLLAISPWHLFTSQFARYWSLVYALATLLYLLMPWAVDADRRRLYLLTLLTILVGALTHPTFVFPVVGVAIAVLGVANDGHIRWPLPSRRGWIWLWGPLAAIGLAGTPFLLSGHPLPSVREYGAILRLVPAIVQWLSPVVTGAAIAGALLLASRTGDRRWGGATILGALTTVVVLLFFSARSAVYADYAMAMLPLIFVTVGAVVQRTSEHLANSGRTFAAAATLVIAAGVLPSTLSHLSDGTRYDFRPAYERIERVAPERFVLAWPPVIGRYYAPRLDIERFSFAREQLETTLQESGPFWLVTGHRRHGMVFDTDGNLTSWVEANCRRVLQTQRPRLDYRVYRVELHSCGSSAYGGR